MVAPRKYPDELRERAIRLVLDTKADPAGPGGNVYRRIGEQLGINPETLRGWVKQAESVFEKIGVSAPCGRGSGPSWMGGSA